TAFIADTQRYALQAAEPGLSKQAAALRASAHDIICVTDTADAGKHDAHIGDAAHVLASLAKDSVLARVTDILFQVHSVEPSHQDTLRSI
ncbi:putative FMN-dependent luciferase-like monooxygenase, partial [Klebsiella pneumoniae]|nr:putative FMN-dependent luciferase-like monooxygenase [Klebsiella pneumoniae]